MKPTLTILDYSVHGNTIDAESDHLLAAAAAAAGVDAVVQNIAPGDPARVHAQHVWLRYDLRSRRELSWIVTLADDLRREGHRVFPTPLSILLAGDKWETYHALRAAGIPTPATWLLLDRDSVQYPAMLKPRVGWGGKANRVARDRADSIPGVSAEESIGQPFIPHDRMWIAPVAAGAELPAIEERRDPERYGEVRLSLLPDGAPALAAAAARALGLPAATVDLIESPEGTLVLEVNSAPCIPYPEIPAVDLAGPMLRAVLDWMARDDPGRAR